MLFVGVLVLAVLVMADSDSDEEMHAIAEAQARAIAARQAVVSPRVEPMDAGRFLMKQRCPKCFQVAT